LPIADDELALTATDRDGGVDSLDAGLERRLDRRSVHDRRSQLLDRNPLLRRQSSSVVQWPAKGINDASQKRLTDRRIDHSLCPTRFGAFEQSVGRSQQNDTALMLVETGRDRAQTTGKDNQLIRTQVREAADRGDTITDMRDPSDVISDKG